MEAGRPDNLPDDSIDPELISNAITVARTPPILAALRAGDPLGLGRARPAPPPDPDKHDLKRENTEYARSLMGVAERAALDKEIKLTGYMTPAQVRALIEENTARGSIEAGGLDPEMLALVDARINYKLFVSEDNVYTREELYKHFAFPEFNVEPESIFAQQEIGIFPAKKNAILEDLEYVARDVGDDSVAFLMVEDLVGQATRRDYKLKRAPLRIVKTKIYIGKERWTDFVFMQRFARGAAHIAAAQGPGGGGVFATMLGGGAPQQALLTDSATLAAQQKAREEEWRRREDEIKRREEAAVAAQKLAAENQKRIDADMKRIESMLAAAAEMSAARATAARKTAAAKGAPPSAAVDDDSVSF